MGAGNIGKGSEFRLVGHVGFAALFLPDIDAINVTGYKNLQRIVFT